jgi:ABC-type branched-subunit amino acid transport system ATPase component
VRRACTVTRTPPLASVRTTAYQEPRCVHSPAHWQPSLLIVIDLVNLADSPALTIGDHQQLEIIRLVPGRVRVLILDEPTSATVGILPAALCGGLIGVAGAGFTCR